MKNTVRTIYGAYLQNCMFYGEQPVIMPNSTLNQKFDVAKDQLLKKGEFPIGQYIAIGLNGATREPNANGRLVTKYREYIPSWGSLLEYFPFIMRPLAQDLTPDERAFYRMRKILMVNGEPHAAYYLRRLDLTKSNTEVSKQIRTPGQGVSVSAWEPTLADLNPTPLTMPLNSTHTTTEEYLVVNRRIELNFTENDVQEILNCANLLYNDEYVADITELAMVTGVERMVPGNFNGIQSNYMEAIAAQVSDFFRTFISFPNQRRGYDAYLDGGTNEPLLVVAPR